MTEDEQAVADKIANWLQRRATSGRMKARKIVFDTPAARRTADLLKVLADHDEKTSLAIRDREWDR